MAPTEAKFEVKDHIDEGRCWSRWSISQACENEATFIIENTTNNGYGLMCDEHCASFRTRHPGHYEVRPYSVELSRQLQERLDREGVDRK